MGVWVNQQILRLDVPVTVAKSVDVGKCSQGLVCVQFYQDCRDLPKTFFGFSVVLQDSEYSFWNQRHDDIQIDLIVGIVPFCVESML